MGKRHIDNSDNQKEFSRFLGGRGSRSSIGAVYVTGSQRPKVVPPASTWFSWLTFTIRTVPLCRGRTSAWLCTVLLCGKSSGYWPPPEGPIVSPPPPSHILPEVLKRSAPEAVLPAPLSRRGWFLRMPSAESTVESCSSRALL